jgi:MerR family transcriptional regulator, thiopeptide resistance regulator
MSYSVGELAKLAGVTIRTLHHYDRIGLLKPSDRSRSGYRQYSAADAERLHHILVYRELGFDLAGISGILAAAGGDAVEQLRRQYELLRQEVRRLNRMIGGVEAMMNAKRTGVHLTPDEMREVFGDFNPADHAAEAEQRWGNTDAFRESQRRAASYDKAKWLEIRDEAEEISRVFAEAMTSGQPSTGSVAMDLAERHRQHISRWFYDCGYDIHRGLAGMYVADPRFSQTYDRLAPGLSGYVREAILANADRSETTP